jgi:Protein of unknown function (DUF3800)
MLTVRPQTRQNLSNGFNHGQRGDDKARLRTQTPHRGSLLCVIGSTIVRIAFSDESGVGNRKKEPITFVTAVVMNMDRQWKPVSNELYSILVKARKEHKGLLENNRSLKGKLLYSAVRRGIAGADAILRAMLEVVATQSLLVFYGAVDRVEFEHYRGLLKVTEREKQMTPFDKAFEACFSIVDRTVRTLTDEQILWIADRSDRERESATKDSLVHHRLKELTLMVHGIIAGQSPMPLLTGVSRIADTVYFGSSKESVALQLADVCCSTVTLHLLEQDYKWSPVVEPYYEIIRAAILNHGTPVLFPPSKKK